MGCGRTAKSSIFVKNRHSAHSEHRCWFYRHILVGDLDAAGQKRMTSQGYSRRRTKTLHSESVTDTIQCFHLWLGGCHRHFHIYCQGSLIISIWTGIIMFMMTWLRRLTFFVLKVFLYTDKSFRFVMVQVLTSSTIHMAWVSIWAKFTGAFLRQVNPFWCLLGLNIKPLELSVNSLSLWIKPF